MLNRTLEPTARAWVFRALLGPAQLLDGLAATLTVGTLSLGLALKTARALARSRMRAQRVG